MMRHGLSELPYSYSALDHAGITYEQLVYHHNRHHKAYATSLKRAARSDASLGPSSLESVIQTYSGDIYNSATQVFNHDFYWNSMSPFGGNEPTGKLLAAINSAFGSVTALKESFSDAAQDLVASGWVWLVYNSTTSALEIFYGDDDTCPVTKSNLTPILALDMWEHAYYIAFKGDVAAYLSAYWDVVNWKFAAANYAKATGDNSASTDDL